MQTTTVELPPNIRLKAKWPAELTCNNQKYTLVEHEFWTAWPDDPAISRGPLYIKAGEPRDEVNPKIYLPCIGFLTKQENTPSAMHALNDAPTELDAPLREYSAGLE